jgi:hypothetical protein
MTLRAAFGSLEYTPLPGSAFGRLSHHTLRADGVHSPLTARLVLVGDEQRLVGLLVLDQNFVARVAVNALRRALANALGVPREHFLVCATHTHNSPGLVPWRPDDNKSYELLGSLCSQIAQLAGRLRQALQPVSLWWSATRVPGLVVNRRSVYRAVDGREQVGTHGPRRGAAFLRPEDQDEDELRTVVVRDRAGNAVGALVNFACHPTTMYARPVFSADYPGVLRSVLEGRLGAPVLFLNGFAGDQSPTGSGEEGCARLGSALADAAFRGAPEAAQLGDGERVASLRTAVALRLRVPTPGQAALAWEHLEQVLRGRRPPALVSRLYGYAHAFYGERPEIDDWLAREIIGRWELLRRGARRAPRERLEVQVLRVGALAIAGWPGEPFACYDRRLRDESPLPHLLCVEHANGFAGYLPPAAAFQHGGYECCLAEQSRFEHAAGERLTTHTLELLNQSVELDRIRAKGYQAEQKREP